MDFAIGSEYKFETEEERQAWEEEQRQLDRMWYQNDEGHDFEIDPFNNDVCAMLPNSAYRISALPGCSYAWVTFVTPHTILQSFIAKKEEEVKKKVTNRKTMMQQRVCE